MAYPASIYTQSNVAGTTLLATDDHANRHNTIGAEVASIETTLGTNSGTSVLKNFVAGNMAARTNDETFTSPTITGGTVSSKIGLMTNGTIGTTTLGSSTITGGTANAVDMRGYFCSPVLSTTAGTGGTTTLNLASSNEHRVTFGTNNGTLAVSNAVNGQKFIVSLTQDAVGTRTVVWFPTIKWVNDGTPTLTATAAKRDVFGFIATGTATFDGFIIGQNI
jgi:hypothetical protein